MPDARPEPFLRIAAGAPRGFWGRGDRWVAHLGSVATVAATPDDPDRFERVRALASEWVGDAPAGASPPREGDGRRPRFYGGFSFRDEHRAAGRWEAFPAALFLLPRAELECDAHGTGRLRLRAVVEEAEGDPTERLEAEALRLRERLGGAPEGGPERARVLDPAAAHRPDVRRAWDDAVREALRAIGDGRIRKAVLARTRDLAPGAAGPDPADVALSLWRQSRGTHAFLFEPRPGHALVGAAPETVATLRRGVFHATAVAGSTRHGEDEPERRRLAAALLASDKDREEQAMVVEEMLERLAPLAASLEAPEGPHVLSLARIQHLETALRARVPGRHVLELVKALHPTPAVCGLPRDAALDFLGRAEPFERGWYAGPVGWFDGCGDGVFVPALRTALVQHGTWRLYAGAGIVAGSEPAAEWEETSLKFEPVLRALAGEDRAPERA